MILSFKTEINGVRTFFKERILCHLGGLSLSDYVESYSGLEYEKICYKALIESLPPKKLTIRYDPHNRWSAGQKIHFATGARTKLYDNFAMGKCAKVSTVVFTKNKEADQILVFLEGRDLTASEVKQLAQDDGFDDVYTFLDFHLGKITIATRKIIYF